MTVSVLIDATKTGTAIGGASGTSFTDSTLTVGNHVGLVMVVFLGWSANPGTVTVTWDSGGTNQVATALPGSPYSPSGGNYCGMWAVLNPTQGNKTLSVSWTNSAAYVASFGSFYNANTGSLADCFYGVQTQFQATGSTTSINVTTNQAPGNADMSLSMMTAGDASTIINPFVLQFWGPDNQTGIGALGGICYNGNAQGNGSTVNFQTNTSASAQTYAINIQALPYNEVFEKSGTPKNTFAPAAHAIRSALRQNPADDVPQVATYSSMLVVNYDDGYLSQAAVASRLVRQVASSSSPQPETNVSFLGRHTPPRHLISPLLRMNPGVNPAVTSAEPHFIGRFTAPVYARFEPDELWSFDTSTPQKETNPHFLGRFAAAKHVVLQEVFQTESVDVPGTVVQPETNTNFLGRFAAPRHARFTSTTDTGVGQPETNTHVIGRFSPVRYARLALSSNDTSTPQPETNVHFVGRHAPARHSRLPITSFDSAVPQVETNPHFLGRHAPTRHSRLSLPSSWDTSAPQVETNPHWLGRHAPARHALLPLLRQGTTDAPAVVVPADAPPSFLGVFEGYTFSLLGLVRQNTSDVTPETNTHFLGKFVAPAHSILQTLRQNSVFDGNAPPPPVETNVSFLGRFTAPKHARFNFNTEADSQQTFATYGGILVVNYDDGFAQPPKVSSLYYWRQGADGSGPPAQPETNISFLGRFTAPAHARLARSVDTNVLSVAVTETNVHFLGRFAPGRHDIRAAVRQNAATDVPPPEQNPHFVGRYRAAIHARFAYDLAVNELSINISETNTHFLGRHSPARHAVNPALRQTTLSADQQAETNPHFLGRHSPSRHAIFRGNSEWDTSVPQHETNVSFIGRHRAPQHARFPYQGQAGDFAVAPQHEIGVNFIGRFSPPTHNIRRALFGSWTDDVPIIIPIDPQPFVGRHRPTVHSRFRFNSWETTTPPGTEVVETNPHFAGRFSDTRHAILRSYFGSWVNDVPPSIAPVCYATDQAAFACLVADQSAYTAQVADDPHS